MPQFTIAQIRIGKVAPLGPNGVPSGIDKHPQDGPVRVGPLGLLGDEQADLRHHGGPNKAIHAYAMSHYPTWIAEYPGHAARLGPGGFGENLVVQGASEAEICLGDHWQIGDTLLEVSQGRQPCWKLNLRFGIADMAYRVQMTGRTGWYFRVIQGGAISAGDQANLVYRPNPDWSLARISGLLYHDRLNLVDLAEFAALAGLPESWQRLAQARLGSGRVEDWSRRIETPK